MAKPYRLRQYRPPARSVPRGRHTLTIEDLSDDGRGVARVDGKTVLVRGALPGETVQARYCRSHSRYDEAETLAVDRASAQRVAPRCRYAGECGGCGLQHLDHSTQLRHKQAAVQHLLAATVDDATEFAEPVSPRQWHYRHRARLQVQAGKHGVELGFRRPLSHRVVAVGRCEVLAEPLNQLLSPLREWLQALPSARAIEEVLLHEDSDGRRVVTLLSRRALPAAPLAAFADSESVAVVVAKRRGEGVEPVWHSDNYDPLCYRNGAGQTLYYQPLAFTQVNPAVNSKLVTLVRDWLAPTAGSRLVDYFCGIGNFALPLAAGGAEVTGYELDAGAVAAASDNARRNGIGNARFEQRDLYADVAVPDETELALLDPPRAGARQLCSALAGSSCARLVYVSCNPATFARDAQILRTGGLELKRVQLLDMFPHTSHVEVAALFTRR